MFFPHHLPCLYCQYSISRACFVRTCSPILYFTGPLTGPLFIPPGDTWMNMQQQWNDIGRGNQICNICLYFSDGNTDTMLYAVLWLPSRFTQLYIYVVTLIIACLLMILMLCQRICYKFSHKLRRTVSM